MTQSIPNSFSSDDLQALMEQAAEREVEQAQADNSDSGHTYGSQELNGQQMMKAALKLIEESFDICNDPVFHKAIVCELINNMVLAHSYR